jgi:hypothetical protein
LGKKKTIKGTPDSLMQIPNGKYLLFQYSTDVTAGIVKIEEDIKKCLDTNLTHIAIDEIEKIVIFLNFNLKPKDVTKISDFSKNIHIECKVYTNSDFAIQLLANYRDLISQYLDLHFDTGQIVPIETFVDEYNKASSGMATPLDNTFLFREKEIQEIIDALGKYDFTIVTGSPGIGKTKLALESLRTYSQLNTSFISYCISYKSMVVFNDLEQHINKNDSSIIFVDDANRTDSFSQILGFYRTVRNGKLKIICTVRDYALEEIKILCGDYSFYEVNIKKLTEKQIIDIIKAEPFHILNQEYHDKIANIADGNPRLAIMASRLAIAKQQSRIFMPYPILQRCLIVIFQLT